MRVALGIPTATARPARRHAIMDCHCGSSQRVRSHQSSTVADEAQVPGPGRIRPIPKNVATSVAHRGAGARAGGTALRSKVLLALFFGIIFAFRIAYIQQRRRDYIRATGPLTQVDQSATLATERELRILARYQLFTGGAVQSNRAFANHKARLLRGAR